ncbi:uncharacterized protein LOC131728383 [Acipenser ruthenus]|uniref:uncharacterized protein LOC131728383 n=1 Tax=Acipenser ruthenus TaxID=7906 RepID=UPI0027418540|nr:uncharacterized protein LOC131728383 [Acipenser ruthenus]
MNPQGYDLRQFLQSKRMKRCPNQTGPVSVTESPLRSLHHSQPQIPGPSGAENDGAGFSRTGPSSTAQSPDTSAQNQGRTGPRKRLKPAKPTIVVKNPLDNLQDYELRKLLKSKRMEICSIEDPFLLLGLLRDRYIIPEDKYQAITALEDRSERSKALYRLLKEMDGTISPTIRVFWNVLFEDYILSQYPQLQHLYDSLSRCDDSKTKPLVLHTRVPPTVTAQHSVRKHCEAQRENVGDFRFSEQSDSEGAGTSSLKRDAETHAEGSPAKRVRQDNKSLKKTRPLPTVKSPDFAAVRQGLSKMKKDLDTVKRERDTVKGELTTVKGELTTVKVERDTVTRQLTTVKGELTTVKRELTTVMRERDTVKRERDTVKRERDTVKRERDTVKRERDTVKRARDTVKGERDTVKRARDTVKRARDTVKGERDTVKDVPLNKISAERERHIYSANVGRCDQYALQIFKSLVNPDILRQWAGHVNYKGKKGRKGVPRNVINAVNARLGRRFPGIGKMEEQAINNQINGFLRRPSTASQR